MESLQKIKVYKSFLKEEDYKKVLEDTLYSKLWEFGKRSVPEVKETPPFWRIVFNENSYYNDYLLKYIEEKTGKKFKCLRVYANAKTYGQDGLLHKDHENEEGKIKYYTFCLYVSPLQNSRFNLIGGELQFKLPELDEDIYELSILCNPNQGVLFPSHYWHRGMSYKRYTHELRICVAWKLELLD